MSGRRFARRFRLLARGRRICGPEMPAAPRAHPELVGRPRAAGGRIAQLHLRAAALTPDLNVDVAHAGDSIRAATEALSRMPQRHRNTEIILSRDDSGDRARGGE